MSKQDLVLLGRPQLIASFLSWWMDGWMECRGLVWLLEVFSLFRCKCHRRNSAFRISSLFIMFDVRLSCLHLKLLIILQPRLMIFLLIATTLLLVVVQISVLAAGIIIFFRYCCSTYKASVGHNNQNTEIAMEKIWSVGLSSNGLSPFLTFVLYSGQSESMHDNILTYLFRTSICIVIAFTKNQKILW